MKRYLSGFSTNLPYSLVYMLQASEYDLGEYFAWFWRAPNLRQVANRRKLELTSKARLLLASAWVLMILLLVAVVTLALDGRTQDSPVWLLLAVAVLAALPVFTAYMLALPLWVGKILIQKPRERTITAHAAETIKNHPGFRIAIAGSYGKTTFKETLRTILGAGKSVAATPGNMNTPLGISRFAQRLTGKEEVLIFELGEYYPGDIKELCELTRPQMGIITGINEAHLDKFKSLDRTVATIFELADFIPDQPVYKNGDNKLVLDRAPTDPLLYTQAGVSSWKVTDVKVSLTGTSFTARNGAKTIKAQSALLGIQQVGPLVACIDIADRLGLSAGQITSGIEATQAFEHRMQPRNVAGATVIDDTYNGNTDGVRAGLVWLASVTASRRIYVTPGLVELGSHAARVHQDIGRQLATSADVVVLMKNSTTESIREGLTAGGFNGQLQIVDNPLRFYTNIDQFVAAGDVVLMQNDWTDNYA